MAWQFLTTVTDERALAYQGDAAIHANRRQACSTWSRANVSAYCYRFDVPLYDQASAQHGNEMPFVLNNIGRYGHDADPISGDDLPVLAGDISSSWVSFIATLDPNSWRQQINSTPTTPAWPEYAAEKAYEMVFQANGTSHVERDVWRATQIRLINGEPSGIAVAYQR